VELVHRTVDRLPPDTLINAWVTAKHGAGHPSGEALWQLIGPPTIDCLADGCRTLAMLWSSAWKEAQAKSPAANPVSVDDLTRLYLDPAFAPSTYLPDHIPTW
jgi:hypothetical protein